MDGAKPPRHVYDCMLCIATNVMFDTKSIRPSAEPLKFRHKTDRQTDRQTENLQSFKVLHTNFYASQVLCWSPRVRVVSRPRVYTAVSCSIGVFNANNDLHITTAVYV